MLVHVKQSNANVGSFESGHGIARVLHMRGDKEDKPFAAFTLARTEALTSLNAMAPRNVLRVTGATCTFAIIRTERLSESESIYTGRLRGKCWCMVCQANGGSQTRHQSVAEAHTYTCIVCIRVSHLHCWNVMLCACMFERSGSCLFVCV